MGKAADNSVLDALLAKIATGTIMTVCSAQPTSRTEAVTTYALADVTPTFASVVDGSPNGRTLSVDLKNAVLVDTGGTATHVAICDGTTLLYVTTCTSQALTGGNNVNIPAWTVNVADPT